MHLRPFFQIENRPLVHRDQRPEALIIAISANYHQLLNIPLLQGRYLKNSDDENNPGSIVINQAFAELFFVGQNPVGKRISRNEGASWQTIRGVVANVRELGVDIKPEPTVYYPYMEGWQYELRLMIKTNLSVSQARPIINSIVHQVNRRQPVANMKSFSLIRDERLAPSTLVSLLVSLFALLAFLITLSGVVGVVAYNVSQRKKEIGIRVALGADPKRIRNLFAIQGLSLATFGVLIGAIVMAFISPLLDSVLFATNPLDLTVYLATALVVILVVAVAILLPVRQATAVQPNEALREQ